MAESSKHDFQNPICKRMGACIGFGVLASAVYEAEINAVQIYYIQID